MCFELILWSKLYKRAIQTLSLPMKKANIAVLSKWTHLKNKGYSLSHMLQIIR